MGGQTNELVEELPAISPCAGATARLGLETGLGIMDALCISSSTISKASWREEGSTSGQVDGASCAPTSAAGGILPGYARCVTSVAMDVLEDEDEDDDEEGDEDADDGDTADVSVDEDDDACDGET